MSRNIPTFLIPGNPLSPTVVSGKAVSVKASTARSSSLQNTEETTQPNTFAKALTKALKPATAKNNTVRNDKTTAVKNDAKGQVAEKPVATETEPEVETTPAMNLKSETVKSSQPAGSELAPKTEESTSDADASASTTMALLATVEVPVSPLPTAPSAALLLQALPNVVTPIQHNTQNVSKDPVTTTDSANGSILEARPSSVDASPVVIAAASIPMDALPATSPLSAPALKIVSPSMLSAAALHSSLAQPVGSQPSAGIAALNQASDEAGTTAATPAPVEQTESAAPVATTPLDATTVIQALTPTLLASLPTAGVLATNAVATPSTEKNTKPMADSISAKPIPADFSASPVLNTLPNTKAVRSEGHSQVQGTDNPDAFTMPTLADTTASIAPDVLPASPEVTPSPANVVSSLMDTSNALPVGLFAEASLLSSNGVAASGLPQEAIEGVDAANGNPLEAIAPQSAKATPASRTPVNAASVKAASIFSNAQATGTAASKPTNGMKSLSEMNLDETALDSLTVESSISDATVALPTPLELASANGSVTTPASTNGAEATQSPLPPAFTSNAAHPADQVLEVTAYGAKNGQRELIIRLNPDNLGEVRVTLSAQDNGGLSARLVASTPESHALLSSQAESLKTSLEAQGVRVDRLNVVLAGQMDTLRDPVALAVGSNFHSASDNGSSDQNHSQQFSQEFSKDNNAFNSSMNGQSSDDGAAARQAAMNDSGAFQQRQNGYVTNPATGLRQTAASFEGETGTEPVSTASAGRPTPNHSGQVSVLA